MHKAYCLSFYSWAKKTTNICTQEMDMAKIHMITLMGSILPLVKKIVEEDMIVMISIINTLKEKLQKEARHFFVDYCPDINNTNLRSHTYIMCT